MNNEERTPTLIELCANYARELSSKDAEIQRLMQVITRKHSVTPVSEQEIKEEAERRYPPNLTEKQVGLKWTTIDEDEPERKAFIAGAALTAHQTSNSVNILTELGGKQHTDK